MTDDGSPATGPKTAPKRELPLLPRGRVRAATVSDPTPSDADTLVVGDPERAPSAMTRGTSVGRYVVLDPIGAGGAGTVYAAYDPTLDRNVALKLLDTVAGRDPRAERVRLLHEARAMARLSHPNVIAVHDMGIHGEQVFVVMEFVDGETLTGWMRDGPHPWRAVLTYLLAAGRGLRHAHRTGVVHGDFKPDNVMIDVDGRVRVLDFGMASAADDASGRAQLGTPAYMAPEMHRGQPPNARSDQYAFSVTLFEALYGARPYTADTVPALVFEVLHGIMAPTPDDTRVPERVHDTVSRGLRRDPEQRFGSMGHLLAALGRALAR